MRPACRPPDGVRFSPRPPRRGAAASAGLYPAPASRIVPVPVRANLVNAGLRSRAVCLHRVGDRPSVAKPRRQPSSSSVLSTPTPPRPSTLLQLLRPLRLPSLASAVPVGPWLHPTAKK
eukprot:gene2282-3139_t